MVDETRVITRLPPPSDGSAKPPGGLPRSQGVAGVAPVVGRRSQSESPESADSGRPSPLEQIEFFRLSCSPLRASLAGLKEGQPYWHGKPHIHDGRCFIHSLPDGRAFVLHRAGVYAKLRLGTASADPITRLPHKLIVAGAIDFKASRAAVGRRLEGIEIILSLALFTTDWPVVSSSCAGP